MSQPEFSLFLEREDVLPSAAIPFLNVKTDGREKDRHNREILFLVKLLKAAGINDYCMHHVNDAGMNKSLPLTLKGKWYDISYVAPDGEVFMIEMMRVSTVYERKDEVKKPECQKEK